MQRRVCVELERLRPVRIAPRPATRRAGVCEVLRLLACDRGPLTAAERGRCAACVVLLWDEADALRRSVRQSDRSITCAQRRARGTAVCV